MVRSWRLERTRGLTRATPRVSWSLVTPRRRRWAAPDRWPSSEASVHPRPGEDQGDTRVRWYSYSEETWDGPISRGVWPDVDIADPRAHGPNRTWPRTTSDDVHQGHERERPMT